MNALAIVPARNEAVRLPETLHALSRMPAVSHILVVDDNSTDGTSRIARESGAEVTKNTSSPGKGGALLTGLSRARSLHVPSVLLADADLGPTASRLSVLLDSVDADCPLAVAAFPDSVAGGGGFGLVKRFARRAIASRTGFTPAEPLSGQRALLTDSLDLIPGVAPGFGAEVGLTLDFLASGITPLEVPVDLSHRSTGKSVLGFAHRARQGLDVARALRGSRIPWETP